MVNGRFYSSEYPTDTASIVINETAAKIIDRKEILGEKIDLWGMKLKVIGVMKDFRFLHFSGKMQPLFIYYTPTGKGANYILVKASNGFDAQTMLQIKKIYAQFYPEHPFESTLLEDDFHKMFAEDNQMKVILSQFTVFAILISCVGLLSLAAYIVEQQRKSLVLRKIHGASIVKVLIILLESFTKWVLISGIIAIPLAYLTIKSIFKNYAYHTELSWWIFVGALFAALAMAIITVLYQAIKAAKTNPVEALRFE
jgi:putative ABC transport system permease protein